MHITNTQFFLTRYSTRMATVEIALCLICDHTRRDDKRRRLSHILQHIIVYRRYNITIQVYINCYSFLYYNIITGAKMVDGERVYGSIITGAKISTSQLRHPLPETVLYPLLAPFLLSLLLSTSVEAFLWEGLCRPSDSYTKKPSRT
jgi:hypothetical protein